MENHKLSVAQSNLKVALWNAEADSITSSQLYAEIQELGLPQEVVIRLHELITFTKKVTGKVYAMGKIVLLKIIEFVKAHPFLVAGAGIGAVVGAAITGLITSIPFLGPILAPIAAVLGITITMIGMVLGHNLDKQFPGVGKDIAEIIQTFFSLFSDVFNTVFREVIVA